MGQRPEQFNLMRGHPLWRDCGFAGLGRHHHSTYYHDDSLYYNHGTLTSMDPSTDWVFNAELGRWVTTYSVLASYIDVEVVRKNIAAGQTAFSIVAWARPTLIDANARFVFNIGSFGGTSVALHRGISGTWAFLTPTSHGGIHLFGNTPAVVNEWSCVAGTWSASANIQNLYLNGFSDVSPAATTLTALNSTTVTSETARIGRQAKSPFETKRFWMGDISDVLLFSRVLTPVEVALLADRSDPMLGGALLYPRRVSFPAAAVGAVPWAYRHRLAAGHYIGA